MASSYSTSLTSRYPHHVYVSGGPDLHYRFFGHLSELLKKNGILMHLDKRIWNVKEEYLHKEFTSNGISMFDDQEIERGQTIAPEPTQAIRESRISIVVLSKNYASSSWCMDELLEILTCKKDMGQIVMAVFYGVDPSDVRNQTGEFGEVFWEMCRNKLGKKIGMWSQALNALCNLPGHHRQNRDKAPEMIANIVADVSHKLNATISKNFQTDARDIVPAGIPKMRLRRAINEPSIRIEKPIPNQLEWLSSSSSIEMCSHLRESVILNHSQYRVFTSFHGPDVHKTLLSHLRKQFTYNGISMFDDLLQAITDSRISIVVLSKNYASSKWCLNELLEILKCKEDMGQIVMTVFYGVDPSDVRNQTGEFGIAFNETCARETKLKRNMWSEALYAVSNIAGEDLRYWDQESDMIENIVRDVSDKLNATKEPTKKSCYSTGMAFLVVINLLLEVVSAVADQLSSIRKPYFARISLVTAILSVILSILELTFKIRIHKARFKWKRPMPWFYYPSRNYNRIFGNFTDTVILFCAVGQLIVSMINFSFTERRLDGPIKVSVWPLFFAIGMVGSKFMEKPLISKEN